MYANYETRRRQRSRTLDRQWSERHPQTPVLNSTGRDTSRNKPSQTCFVLSTKTRVLWVSNHTGRPTTHVITLQYLTVYTQVLILYFTYQCRVSRLLLPVPPGPLRSGCVCRTPRHSAKPPTQHNLEVLPCRPPQPTVLPRGSWVCQGMTDLRSRF